jgi:replicative DNA helicase
MAYNNSKQIQTPTMSYDITAEKAFMSACFQQPNLLDELDFRAEWFSPINRTILQAMTACSATLDPVIVGNLLQTQGAPREIWLIEVMAIFNEISSPANASYYLEIVKSAFANLTISQICQNSLQETTQKASERLGNMETALGELNGLLEAAGTREMAFPELLEQTIANIEERFSNRGQLQGVAIGIPKFDQMTGGFRAGQSVIIAARPGEGKTAFMLQIARYSASRGIPVGIISMEMSAVELVERILSSESRVDGSCIRDAMLTNSDFQHISHAVDRLKDFQIYIDDRGGLTIQQIKSKAKRWRRQRGIKILVVDYMQLAKSTSRRAQDSKQVEISEISAAMKELAKELQIPIITLAQLNRDSEKGTTRRKPRLSDLRESGSIEQDADKVILLHREGETEENPRQILAIIAKQRNGETGEIPLDFLTHVQLFTERSSK